MGGGSEGCNMKDIVLYKILSIEMFNVNDQGRMLWDRRRLEPVDVLGICMKYLYGIFRTC